MELPLTELPTDSTIRVESSGHRVVISWSAKLTAFEKWAAYFGVSTAGAFGLLSIWPIVMSFVYGAQDFPENETARAACLVLAAPLILVGLLVPSFIRKLRRSPGTDRLEIAPHELTFQACDNVVSGKQTLVSISRSDVTHINIRILNWVFGFSAVCFHTTAGTHMFGQRLSTLEKEWLTYLLQSWSGLVSDPSEDE